MKNRNKATNSPIKKKLNYLICEGETEEAFFKGLDKFLNDHYDKIRCNLFTGKISNKITASNNINKIYYVIDADMLEKDFEAHIKKYLENDLKIIAKKKYILIQYRNLEDELTRSLNLSKPKLFKLFNAEGENEFKTNFIKNKNLKGKVKGLNLYQLYTNYKNKIDINIINKLKNLPQTGKDIFKTEFVDDN